jgi:hypothetical protein
LPVADLPCAETHRPTLAVGCRSFGLTCSSRDARSLAAAYEASATAAVR